MNTFTTSPATDVTDDPRRAGGPLTGMPRLLRLALRRDRLMLPAWLLGLTAVGGATVNAVTGLYATEAERITAAAFSAENPIARAFNGPASGSDIGALALAESFSILAVLVAIMGIQTVVRHTRGDEEAGRAELLGAAVVGRHARLFAALVVGATASIAAGVLFAGVLLFAGLAVSGSLAAGAALAGVGLVFAGVAGVTAQVSATARGATGGAIATVGVAFLLRALGDTAGEVSADGTALISAWPSWLSPIGWGQQIRAFQYDDWWVVLLFLAAAGILAVISARLSALRDVGAGLVPARRGRAQAPATLRGVFGLAWRLQRGTLAAWAVGLSVIGSSFGGVGESVDELVDNNGQLAELLAGLDSSGSLTDTFFAFTLGLLGVAVSGFVVQATLRMRTEEANGRLEPILGTATARLRWMASHLVITVGGSLALLVVAGASVGVAYVGATGAEVSEVLRLVGAALVQAPAALVLGGLTTVVFAFAPRWASAIGWASVGFAFVIGQLGAGLGLPQTVIDLSPFTHVPAMPAARFELVPIAVLASLAVTLHFVGILGFRRRDLAVSA
jgi:ABC-2 type transport system permease protein